MEPAAGDCAPAPAAGARLVVRASGGAEISRVTANRSGQYSVALPPGRYVVELDPLGVEFTKHLPAEIEIVGGGETRLDIEIDSGIR